MFYVKGAGGRSPGRDPLSQGPGAVQGAHAVKQPAQALRPRHGTERRHFRQRGPVQRLGQLSQDHGGTPKTPNQRRITNEVEGGQLRRSDSHGPRWCVSHQDWDFVKVAAHREGQPNAAAADGAVSPRQHDLKDLGSLVGRAVQLGRGEQGDVVGHPEVLGQVVDEPKRWQAAQTPILRRDDHVESSQRRGDESLQPESPQAALNGLLGATVDLVRFFGGEGAPSLPDEIVEPGCEVSLPVMVFHAQKVTYQMTFCA